ncbi:ATP-dependent DNA helicase [Fusarium oxysporum f. sp. albedinis]|nr:ATP-dependent DNA helicase [Fusarium oxysporum f. sp. albedinis]
MRGQTSLKEKDCPGGARTAVLYNSVPLQALKLDDANVVSGIARFNTAASTDYTRKIRRGRLPEQRAL